uniref:GDT1 family protein n=1 Tax=Plectus sambesii TaxID=2011161 RepID=A0A914XQE6_9BILA
MRLPTTLWLGSLALAVIVSAASAESEPKEVAPADVQQAAPAAGEKEGGVAEDSKAIAPIGSKTDENTATATTRRPGSHSKDGEKGEEGLGIWHAFFASLSVIIVSELGDKTWFIAAIMAMRHSRLTVFFGAMSALALMTVLSACLGWATQIIPRKFTYYVSTALFALFGVKMLMEGWKMSASEQQEEYEEAQAEVLKKENEINKDMESQNIGDVEAGRGGAVYDAQRRFRVIFRFVSKIYIEAFMLTFVAEWGDRSQLTTIILAARESVVGVSAGGILGHAICTGIAVMGGRLVAQQISVRTVTLIGGVVFIVFALSALLFNPDGS